MLLCDGPGCSAAWHTSCLSPPLSAVPDGSWFRSSACARQLRQQPPDESQGRMPRAPGGRLTAQQPPPTQPPPVPEQVGLGICSCCSLPAGPAQLLACTGCGDRVHPTCLGLGMHAYPGGLFKCASCVLLSTQLEAGVETGGATPAAWEAAHNLVWLKGKRVQDSSQATYASALHRFIHFGQTVLQLPTHVLLPTEWGKGPTEHSVQLFVAWAVQRYKVSTVRGTLNALADWCVSKGAPTLSVRNRAVEGVLYTASVEQGQAGLPVGKRGMSSSLLQLLLAWLGACSRGETGAHPDMAPLMPGTRPGWCWGSLACSGAASWWLCACRTCSSVPGLLPRRGTWHCTLHDQKQTRRVRGPR